MEHLPLPAGKKHFIVAPYEAPESDWFDISQESFLSFPSSRHWTEAQLRGGDETTKDAHLDPDGFHIKGSPQKVEQFFQTWLFFGLAIDVLRLGGVCAWVEDFLKPATNTHPKARIVDTSKLPRMLVEWEKGIKARGRLKADWDTLNEMFERAGTILDRFCKLPHEEDNSPLQQEKPRPWPVRDEIATTLIAMTCTLSRAAYNVYSKEINNRVDGASLWPKTARSGILTRRLETKWCVADVMTTLTQLPIDGHYYLAASAGLEPDELDHHAKCVRAHCRYEYDAHMYRTRHVTDDGCREEVKYGGHLGPERGQRDWYDAMTRIIDKDAIPIALWNKGRKELWSVEYHLTGQRQPEFVAISHVWTDGKGNPDANSLPECQLDRIQRLVEGVTWEGRRRIPDSDYRSDGVGFWMDTLCIPVEDRVRKDKAITTMRRVYSEAKAVLVLDDWLQEVRFDAPPLDLITRIYQSNWIKRLWTHQEGFLPKALWLQFQDRAVEINELSERFRTYESSLQKQGIHLGFPVGTEMRLVGQYTALQRMFGLTSATDKWRLYFPLAAAMSERKTSRLADETICLATIVDMPLPDLQKIPAKPDADSGRKRMALFLQRLRKFDTGVIFNNYPRLDQRGYRWAPRSLLNFRTAEITYTGAERRSDIASFDPDRQPGLLVHYHGFLVNFGVRKPFASVERGCAIQCADSADSAQELDAKWFLVQLPRDNSNVEWQTWQTYAVILSEIPKQKARAPAVVASLQERHEDGVHVVIHQSIATVWVTEEPPEGVDTVRTALLRKGTGWLVG
ncbi:hypothetical protein BDW72DRAFT_209892 [Aspergillus terricola var. indicus]